MTTSFVPRDQVVRDRAIKDFQRSLAVEASAGTGKTSLLVSRYVELVSSHQVHPSEIVAITFTEKAAAQLKERVRAALLERSLRSEAAELDRAPISTIHAFAASLLRERPIEAAIDPNFEQLDEVASDVFIDRCYETFLPLALEQDPLPLTRALAAGIRLSKVRDLALSLVRNRDLLGHLEAPPAVPDLKSLIGSLARESQALWDLATTSCVDTADAGYRAIESFHRDVERLTVLEGGNLERAFLVHLEAHSRGNKRAWARPEICDEQKERMKAISAQLAQTKGLLRQSIFTGLLGWLRGFVQQVDDQKQETGKLDFDDLLILSRDLLRDHVEVQNYFSKRYRYFLVDEFQDTDPIQMELIWRLASRPEKGAHWSEAPLEGGKLFLVGDPKQSIYRFRRASVEVFDAATRQVARQGERLAIHQNFRSSKPIIDFVNALFEPILSKSGPYEPLVADDRHLFPKDSSAVFILEPGEDSPFLKARDVRSQEAESIAAFLRDLLDNDRPLVFDRSQGSLRRVGLGDIAILFPTTTDLDLYEETLRTYDLPFSLDGGRLFFGRAEVHGLLSALDALLHPADPVAVVSALRSVLFGGSDQDLAELIFRKLPLDYRVLSPEQAPASICPAIEILRTLHTRVTALHPSQLLEALCEMTLAIPLTLTRFHGEQAAANIEKFMAMARALEQQGPLTCLDFLRWARERSDDQDRQAESPLSEGASNRIRLLTVHKAKGLEFPVVVLANLGSQRTQHESVIADRLHGRLALGIGAEKERFSTPDYEDLLVQEKEQMSEESRRLLYVGATRARDLLVLPRFIPDRKTDKSLWALLNEGLPQATAHVRMIPASALHFREESRRTETPTAPPPGGSFEDNHSNVVAYFQTRASTWVPGLPIRTATAMKESPPPRLAPLPEQTWKDTGGAKLGVLFHEAMEQTDFGTIETVLHGPEETRPLLKDLLTKTLESPLAARIRKAKRVLKEVPFSWPRDGQLYEGVIDLAFEEEDGWVIVDYKTDRVTAESLSARADHYRPQLELYRDAFKALTGNQPKELLLFFPRLKATVNI